MSRCTLALALTVTIAACATAPRARLVERTATIPASADQTWDAVIDIFGEQGWAIDNMERVSGLITTDWMTAGGVARSYMDCGGSGIAVDSQHSGRFNVVVRGSDSDASVTVNATFRTYRAFGDAGQWIDCVSTGVLEQYMHERLSLRFGS